MQGDNSQWVYGTGVGTTEQAARRSALRDLASRVLGQFTSNGRVTQTAKNEVSQTASDAEFYSVTNVELESAQIDAISRSANGVNVRIRLPAETFRSLVARSKRKAASLSLFSQIESTPAPSAMVTIRLALAGLRQALKDGVLNERVKTKDRGIETFQQYFQFMARQKAQSLKLLVTPGVKSTDKLTLTLVEMPSLMFQANAPLRIVNKQLTSNGQGVILLPPKELIQKTETQVDLDLDIRRLAQHDLISKNDLIIDRILPPAGSSPAMTQVYLHAHHRNVTTEVIVSVGGVSRYANVDVPSQILLPPGESYVIRVVDSDKNKSISKTIYIPVTAADFYLSLPVEEKRYGEVDLQVDDASATIALSGSGGEVKQQGSLKNQHIEAGRYKITISQEDQRDFQKIIEHITVLPGRAVERKYPAPIDREYYNFGYQIAGTLWHLGREPTSDYKLPGNMTYGEFQSTNDISLNHCAGPVGEARYLTNWANFMYQGHLGIKWCSSGSSNSGRSDVSANIYTAGIGIGFYKKTNKTLYWLSTGINQESIRWDRDQSRFSGLSRGSAKNTYPFIEFGAMFNAFEVRLRVPNKTLSPELSIGFGFHRLKQGYRHPATVTQ